MLKVGDIVQWIEDGDLALVLELLVEQSSPRALFVRVYWFKMKLRGRVPENGFRKIC